MIDRFDDKAASGIGPRFDAWLVRRLLAGMHPSALAVAGGISVRSAYRWRRDVLAMEDVRVGEHVATYVVRRDKTPIRVSRWRPA